MLKTNVKYAFCTLIYLHSEVAPIHAQSMCNYELQCFTLCLHFRAAPVDPRSGHLQPPPRWSLLQVKIKCRIYVLFVPLRALCALACDLKSASCRLGLLFVGASFR